MRKPSYILAFLLVVALPASSAAASAPDAAVAAVDQQQPPGPPQPSPESLARDLGIGVDEQATISRFLISGNTVYGDQQLQELLASWRSKPVTAKDLLQAVDAIRARYRNAGFAYADVHVPAQKLEGGSLRLEVLEGRVGSVSFAGNRRYSSEFLSRRISDLAPGKVITNDAFQRSVILLNTLPGLMAQIAIKPSGTPGTFDVAAGVREDPFQGTGSADNYIRSEFGSLEMKLSLNVQNATRRGDTITVEPAALQKKWPSGIRLGYTVPVGHRGTSLNLMYINAKFQFVTGSPLMGLQNDISYTVAQVTHPLKMSFLRNVFFTAGFVRATSAYVLGATQFGPTETLNVGTASIVLAQGQAGKATTNAFAQFTTNFRRNPDGQRNNAEPARLDLAAGHEQWFKPNLSLFLFGIAVLSRDPLLSSQKVTIGGPFCVRGFDVNEALGDQGYLIKSELRRQVPLPNKAALTFKVMLDDASVWRKVFTPYSTNPGDFDHLISGGAGVALKVQERYNFSVEFARRLNDHIVRDGRTNGRFWLSASAGF